MATDQATADYEREQEKRAALEDDWAVWAESHSLGPPIHPSQRFVLSASTGDRPGDCI